MGVRQPTTGARHRIPAMTRSVRLTMDASSVIQGLDAMPKTPAQLIWEHPATAPNDVARQAERRSPGRRLRRCSAEGCRVGGRRAEGSVEMRPAIDEPLPSRAWV